jgi:hypothetical protein
MLKLPDYTGGNPIPLLMDRAAQYVQMTGSNPVGIIALLTQWIECRPSIFKAKLIAGSREFESRIGFLREKRTASII